MQAQQIFAGLPPLDPLAPLPPLQPLPSMTMGGVAQEQQQGQDQNWNSWRNDDEQSAKRGRWAQESSSQGWSDNSGWNKQDWNDKTSWKSDYRDDDRGRWVQKDEKKDHEKKE